MEESKNEEAVGEGEAGATGNPSSVAPKRGAFSAGATKLNFEDSGDKREEVDDEEGTENMKQQAEKLVSANKVKIPCTRSPLTDMQPDALAEAEDNPDRSLVI